MSTKYTPAPWQVEGTTVYALEHYGWKKGEEQFCNRFTASVQRGQKENKDELLANAKLIAAAPEILEALQEMVNGDKEAIEEAELLGIPFPEPMLESYKKAVAAIAKALGSQA